MSRRSHTAGSYVMWRSDCSFGAPNLLVLGAGCVEVRREYTGRRVRSWIRITAHGVGELREEVEVLRLLLDVLDSR
ncbi:hypothetical protein [Prescottella equi]|uniref:hypothetical protein n=1 Tax=Rhodococcus hoagii TaxID=43767 RepID=UPI0012F921E9|nr:hypothetical protein [Prescottella equi]